ncbi:hypothetical protein DSECCO2_479100 [anaerobic digester metagenome]
MLICGQDAFFDQGVAPEGDHPVSHHFHRIFIAQAVIDAGFAEIFGSYDVDGVLRVEIREFQVFHIRQDTAGFIVLQQDIPLRPFKQIIDCFFLVFFQFLGKMPLQNIV